MKNNTIMFLKSAKNAMALMGHHTCDWLNLLTSSQKLNSIWRPKVLEGSILIVLLDR